MGAATSLCLCCKGSRGAAKNPSMANAAVPQCKEPCFLPPCMLCTAALSSIVAPIPCLGRPAEPGKDTVHVCLHFKLPTFSPALFFYFIKIFQKGKKNPCPFPVPPCHVPKVLTNLQCPACTQPPLIAPAFSSGVSSAIATAAPPPPGNSHLHYHSLLQSCPQAPGSEQQLR